MHNSTQTFAITGMDCADCAQTVRRGVAKLEGIQTCELNFTTETLRVEGHVKREAIIARVRELGYNVREPEESTNKDASAPNQPANFLQFMWGRMDTRLALFASLLSLPGLIFHELLPGLGIHHPLIDLASVGAMILAGYPIALSGWRALRINHELTINALMSIAAIGAVIIGAYTEAGIVMVLFVIGEALEGYTAERARHSIRSLMAVAPEEAILLDAHDDHYHEKTVPVSQLNIGDLILVKAGQRIPMDGRVVKGSSSVNQAPITGESRLIEKSPGDEVFASSINGEGTLEIEVTHLAADNTIARLIKMVEEAHEKRAPTQRFVDKFAKVYTPLVVALAAGVAVIPPLFLGQPLGGEQGWLYRGLALLVVACPCALVISTPVSLISAISNAARNGVLFKGGAYVETLSRVRAIAFDKTGTLTLGKPTVIHVQSVECQNPEERCAPCDDLLALASAVEQRSEHPVADAVVHEARHRGVGFAYPAAEGVKALVGRGVVGTVGGQQITIGSHPWFDQHIPHDEHCAEVQAADRHGFTTMMVSRENAYQGYITVADQVRESSQSAMDALKALGLETIMLTGDNETTAQTVAGQVGVTQFQANCLPEQKVAAIEMLRTQHEHVAMVGDGINDTPALATASVGIAIGNTAQAMETADVTLMGDNLQQLPFAVRLARAAMNTIRVNVALSIGIKLAFLVLVLIGSGSMWLAVLADMGTSLLVTINGMRLLAHPKLGE